MLTRLVVSLTVLAAVFTLVGPTVVSARMHFTTTRERLDTLAQRVDSALALTDPAAVQAQLREITSQAQATKTAADEASARPASNADDKSVLSSVNQEMDAVVASANRALAATGADQRTALQDAQARAKRTLTAVDQRIAQQQAAPAPQPSPGTLPNAGQVASPAGPAFGLLALGLVAVLVGTGVLGWSRRSRAGAPGKTGD